MAAKFGNLSAILFAILPVTSTAQDHQIDKNPAPYAGFETREIKSLSQRDIEELRSGGGWGLALPAELNGRPGPAHLLELKDELNLSAKQVQAISTIYDDMRTAAIIAGERYIAAEAALDEAFAGSGLGANTLGTLIDEAADARAALRYVHLSQHLSTPELLSDAQIRKYNVLRGYSNDPCAQVPEGHDADLWRRHNGCG